MRGLVRCSVLLLFTPAVLGAQTPLPRKHAPQPTVPAITANDLMTRLYIFSDDSMMGREAGTLGNVKGTDYIAAQFKQMGVQPAGDDGTYFQTIPYKTRALDTTSTVVVGGTPLKLGDDYLPLGQEPVALLDLPVVYGGVVGDTTHPLARDEAAGKLVVLARPSGPMGRRFFRGASVEGAAAVAVVGLDQLPARFRGFMTRPRAFLDDPAATGPAGGTPSLLISDAAATKIFGRPISQLAVGSAGERVSMHLRFDVKPMPYPARNVVGIIPGSDPKLAGEYVALGAHNDHLGESDTPVDHDSIMIWNHVVRPEGADDRGNTATYAQQREVDSLLPLYRSRHPGQDRMDSIWNGADDDGSGTVSLLEIAQYVMAMKPHPKRSILLVSHVGEEKGLLGSRYFTNHPTVPRDSIVAQLNMDMIGRGDATDETGRTKDGTPRHGGPNYVLLVGSRRLSTELGNIVERVNRVDHHDLTFDYSLDANGHPSNIYCRSDHAEYARFGIPIVFFTTGLHSDYHQVTDEPEYIDYPHMARVASLVADVAVHVADLDHRVVVDHPKPDPNAACRQ